MIITLKGVKDIYSKVKDNHARRQESFVGKTYGMTNSEKADYRDIDDLLYTTINTYEDIQKLTDEVIRIKFKTSNAIICFNHSLSM
jgi:hypothetical protein